LDGYRTVDRQNRHLIGGRLRTGTSRWFRPLAAGLGVLTVFASTACSSGPGSPSQPPPWKQVWADNFNGPADGGLNTSLWRFETGRGIFGTGEIETMTSSRFNAQLDGQGGLKLIVLGHGAAGAPDAAWTSVRIRTRSTFAPPAGGEMMVTASIKQPSPASPMGYWPGFWMLAPRGWPATGEIDIMENVNGRPTAFSTLHCGVVSGGPCNETSGIGGTIDDATLQDGYHVYAMELDKSVQPNQLRFYLDRVNYFTILSTRVPADVWESATNHGFFILLDLAIGGAFPWAECNFFPHPGGCSGSTPFPQVVTPSTLPGKPMKIAYVAVYNK
jgi:beta-glucanase (GH16 family)